jgi:hypothetical protein
MIRPPGFRYGAVFLLTLAVLVFVIVAPATDWSRAVTVALQAAALLVVVATSRVRPETRRVTEIALGTSALAAIVLIGTGVLPVSVAQLISVALTAAIPAALVTGVVRLVREHGVTLRAVAGSLTIYLLLGLLFSAAIGFVAEVDARPYFVQGGDGTPGDRTYFSFTVLTTTGFGDFTAATPVGRAIAVLEMLVGQLYLVTVIGVMIGNLARRQGPLGSP